jgi:chorismate mutase/prephenate dehydratase
MNITEKCRSEVDQIDDQIASLYEKRMELVRIIGNEKVKSDNFILDLNREKSIINRVTSAVSPEIQLFTKQVFNTILDTSKAYQNRYAKNKSTISENIKEVLAKGSGQFPIKATVACQGVAGSYSSLAAERLFELSDIMYFRNFENVFQAVEKGLCEYGVLPIENSSAGSVNNVYDLMKQYRFYIVKSVKLRVQHCLLTKSGTKLGQIREIFSHEQAINQCGNFLKSLKDIKIIVVGNTAVASQMVSMSDRDDVAAMSSRQCADIYGLQILQSSIQDSDNNYTRFICISKDLKIFPGAGKMSIMVTLPHSSGSLNKTLAKFSTIGLNLTKIESRPLPSTDFEFMFYFDFEGNIDNVDVLNLIADLDNGTEHFTFLGSYSEII